MKIKILSIFAVVFAVSMFTALTSASAQVNSNNGLVNPTPPAPKPVSNLLFGCKDGIVLFTNGSGVYEGCIIAPFKFQAFNGVDVKTFNQSNINIPNIHVNVQKICLDAKISKKICGKLPTSVP